MNIIVVQLHTPSLETVKNHIIMASQQKCDVLVFATQTQFENHVWVDLGRIVPSGLTVAINNDDDDGFWVFDGVESYRTHGMINGQVYISSYSHGLYNFDLCEEDDKRGVKAWILFDKSPYSYKNSPISFDHRAELEAKSNSRGYPIIYCNHLGIDGDILYQGNSAIVGGNNRFVQKLFCEGIMRASITDEVNGNDTKEESDIECLYNGLKFHLSNYIKRSSNDVVVFEARDTLESHIILSLCLDVVHLPQISAISFGEVQLPNGYMIFHDTWNIDILKESMNKVLFSGGYQPTHELDSRMLQAMAIRSFAHEHGAVYVGLENKNELQTQPLYCCPDILPLKDIRPWLVKRLAEFIAVSRCCIPAETLASYNTEGVKGHILDSLDGGKVSWDLRQDTVFKTVVHSHGTYSKQPRPQGPILL